MDNPTADTGADSATVPQESTEERDIAAFNTELKELLKKYNLALTGEPLLIPSDDGGFKIYAKPVVFREPKQSAIVTP